MRENSAAGTHQIIVLASSENTYVQKVVENLCHMGWPPYLVFIGSSSERHVARFNSLLRIKRQLGWMEVYKRLRRVGAMKRGANVAYATSTLAELSEKFNFKIENHVLINSGSAMLNMMELNNPVCVLAGCGVVDRSVIRSAGGGCINGHPALLPGLRGVDVIPWALAEGKSVGVTAHKVVESVDAGNIILKREVQRNSGENFIDYLQRVECSQAQVLADAVVSVANGTAVESIHDLSGSVLKFAAPDHVWREAELAFYRNDG